MSSFRLVMKTPEKEFFDGEVTYFDVPYASSRYGVLANHLPMVISVEEGMCYFRKAEKGAKTNIFTLGGVLEIEKDCVTFLSALVEYEEDIEKVLAEREEFVSNAKRRMKESYIEFKHNKVALVSAMKNLAGRPDHSIND